MYLIIGEFTILSSCCLSLSLCLKINNPDLEKQFCCVRGSLGPVSHFQTPKAQCRDDRYIKIVA